MTGASETDIHDTMIGLFMLWGSHGVHADYGEWLVVVDYPVSIGTILQENLWHE
jgi:hypothetical protein